MKTNVFFLLISLVVFSCEKEPVDTPAENENYIPGAVQVEFAKNARLKSAFELVNNFHMEIRYVNGAFFTSELPTDSIDYVIALLQTKSYLNADRLPVGRDDGVYYAYGTGKIAVDCTMTDMDETNQADWAITAAILRLAEQPALKSFFIKVPVGEEIYWSNKFRQESIVSYAELIYIIGYNK